jgi:hypothetical protein
MTPPRLATDGGVPVDGLADDATQPPDGLEPPDKGGGGGGDGGRDEEIFGDCPVVPLGHREGVFFYRDPAGQLAPLPARQHTALGLAGLFGGSTWWLITHFKPTGKRADQNGFDNVRAAACLMRRCHKAGFFSADTQVRGPGAWRGPKGELILHCGDELYVYPPDGGKAFFLEAGQRVGDAFYAAWPPEGKPAKKEASRQDGHALHQLLGKWNWVAPVEAPRLAVGFIAQGYLVGAQSYRSHIWVTGESGTGKSTLQDLIFGTIGSVMLRRAEPSAAAIYQSLQSAARPVAVNEIENSETNDRATAVVELARLGTDDVSGGLGRGSAAGKAVEYQIKAAFYFTSILPPPLKPQDVNRITVLDLTELTIAEGLAEEIARQVSKMVALGPAFQERMARAWAAGRVQANIGLYRAALTRRGHKSRFADQLGTLLGCAETLLSDEVPDEDSIKAYVDTFQVDEFAEHGEEADHDLCRNHLYSSPVGAWASGAQALIGETIADVVNPDGREQEHKRDLLARVGLRIEPGVDGDAAGPYLVVANRHQGLERVFEGTRWSRGVWARSLFRVPGARKGKVMVFAGARSRTIWVPRQDYKPAPAGESVDDL